MLARTYRTAKELGISESEHSALIKTLEHLENKNLPGRLDLDIWYRPTTWCGTTACFAGWAYHFSDETAFKDFVTKDELLPSRSDQLKKLFLTTPSVNSDDFRSSVAFENERNRLATIGLRSYLETGRVGW